MSRLNIVDLIWWQPCHRFIKLLLLHVVTSSLRYESNYKNNHQLCMTATLGPYSICMSRVLCWYRGGMIQTFEQYEFVHYAVRDSLQIRLKSLSSSSDDDDMVVWWRVFPPSELRLWIIDVSLTNQCSRSFSHELLFIRPAGQTMVVSVILIITLFYDAWNFYIGIFYRWQTSQTYIYRPITWPLMLW